MKNRRVGRPLKLPGLHQIKWILENKVGGQEIEKLHQNQDKLINMQKQDNEGKIYKINYIDYMQTAVNEFQSEDMNWKSSMAAFLLSKEFSENRYMRLWK